MVVKDEVLVPRLFIGHLIHLLSTIEDTERSLNCGVFDDLRRRLANSPIKIRANSSTKENEAGNTLATREDDSTSCGGWISCWLITLIL